MDAEVVEHFDDLFVGYFGCGFGELFLLFIDAFQGILFVLVDVFEKQFES